MYRNIYYDNRKGSVTLWTWNDQGDRTTIDVPFKPYLYIESQNYKDAVSIYNTTLRKVEFRNQFERRKYTQESGIKRLFYNVNVEQQYLLENFGSISTTPEFSKHPLKIFFLDIETFSPNEFPKPEEASHPINLITIYDSIEEKFFTWGTGPYKARTNEVYSHCASETELLKRFISYWSLDYPDVVTSWAGESFDIPYIINRITNILGENYAKQLSPVNQLYRRDGVVKRFGKVETKWYIKGVSLLDYMEVYKVFSRSQQESYALDYIAEVELGAGEGKIKYNATSLAQLAETDWQKFVEYNIQDVNVIVNLEEKLRFLAITRMLAYTGLTPMESALGTISVVTGAMAVKAQEKGMIIPTFNTSKQPNYEGGYVKEPNRGIKEHIISYDANSLYPNTIITLNISPETKLGNIVCVDENNVNIRLISGKEYELPKNKFLNFVKKEKIAISKAKVLYSQKSKGFCPELVEGIYKERVENKNDLLKHKKRKVYIEKQIKKSKQQIINKIKKYEEELVDIDMNINHLDIFQYTRKILINRIYGTFANQYSPFCDVDAAASITLTGQACIKEASNIINRHAKEKYGIDEDLNIYSDTDSATGDTRLRLKHCNVTIESLFNEYNKNIKKISSFGHEIIPVHNNNLEILTFNSHSKKVEWGKIKNLIRHKVSKKKYRIKVNGKNITMTEDHGCMVYRNNKLIRISPKEIKKGDKMINIYSDTKKGIGINNEKSNKNK